MRGWLAVLIGVFVLVLPGAAFGRATKRSGPCGIPRAARLVAQDKQVSIRSENGFKLHGCVKANHARRLLYNGSDSLERFRLNGPWFAAVVGSSWSD